MSEPLLPIIRALRPPVLDPVGEDAYARLSVVVEGWIYPKSHKTRVAYESDLRGFGKWLLNIPFPDPIDIGIRLLAMSSSMANNSINMWISHLKQNKYSSNSIARAASTVRSLSGYAFRLQEINWTLSEIRTEKPTPYRDTRGPSPEFVQKMIEACDQTTEGIRDRAVLVLMHDAGFRCGEIASLGWSDLDAPGKRMLIQGKGRDDREWHAIPDSVVDALVAYVNSREAPREAWGRSGPMFSSSTDYRRRLTTRSLYGITQKYRVIAAGQHDTTNVSPHRLRHSGATAVANASNGNILQVQDFLRSKDVNVAKVYVDNLGHGARQARELASGSRMKHAKGPDEAEQGNHERHSGGGPPESRSTTPLGGGVGEDVSDEEGDETPSW